MSKLRNRYNFNAVIKDNGVSHIGDSQKFAFAGVVSAKYMLIVQEYLSLLVVHDIQFRSRVIHRQHATLL